MYMSLWRTHNEAVAAAGRVVVCGSSSSVTVPRSVMCSRHASQCNPRSTWVRKSRETAKKTKF